MPWSPFSAPLEILALVDGSSSLGGCWVSELRYQYLHSTCSYPVNHLFSLKNTFSRGILQANTVLEMYWCNEHCFLWLTLFQNLKTAISWTKWYPISNLIIQLYLRSGFSDCIWISTFTQGWVISVRKSSLETKDPNTCISSSLKGTAAHIFENTLKITDIQFYQLTKQTQNQNNKDKPHHIKCLWTLFHKLKSSSKMKVSNLKRSQQIQQKYSIWNMLTHAQHRLTNKGLFQTTVKVWIYILHKWFPLMPRALKSRSPVQRTMWPLLVPTSHRCYISGPGPAFCFVSVATRDH